MGKDRGATSVKAMAVAQLIGQAYALLGCDQPSAIRDGTENIIRLANDIQNSRAGLSPILEQRRENARGRNLAIHYCVLVGMPWTRICRRFRITPIQAKQYRQRHLDDMAHLYRHSEMYVVSRDLARTILEKHSFSGLLEK